MQRRMLGRCWEGAGAVEGDRLAWWGKTRKPGKAADCSSLLPPCGAATHSLESFKAKGQYWHQYKWASCFQVNLGCHLDGASLRKPWVPLPHALQGLCTARSAVSGGYLRQDIGMMALFVARESWESLVFLISLKKLHIVGENHFSQRYDQKQFQVPDAKET